MKKFLTLALLALSGCTSVFDSSRTHTLTLEDSSAVCRVGDVVAIKLEANPTTGYEWTPSEYNAMVLKIRGREYEPASSLVGSGGVTTVSFEAVEAGESEIVLRYIRPWEKVQASEAKFKILVKP